MRKSFICILLLGILLILTGCEESNGLMLISNTITQNLSDGRFSNVTILSGNYSSIDGTKGFTGTCTIVGLTNFVVKNGIIVSCS